MKMKYEVGQEVEYRQNGQWHPGTIDRVTAYWTATGVLREVAIRMLSTPNACIVKSLDANGESQDVRYPAPPLRFVTYSPYDITISKSDLEVELAHQALDKIGPANYSVGACMRGTGTKGPRPTVAKRIEDLGVSLDTACKQRNEATTEVERLNKLNDTIANGACALRLERDNERACTKATHEALLKAARERDTAQQEIKAAHDAVETAITGKPFAYTWTPAYNLVDRIKRLGDDLAKAVEANAQLKVDRVAIGAADHILNEAKIPATKGPEQVIPGLLGDLTRVHRIYSLDERVKMLAERCKAVEQSRSIDALTIDALSKDLDKERAKVRALVEERDVALKKVETIKASAAALKAALS